VPASPTPLDLRTTPAGHALGSILDPWLGRCGAAGPGGAALGAGRPVVLVADVAATGQDALSALVSTAVGGGPAVIVAMAGVVGADAVEVAGGVRVGPTTAAHQVRLEEGPEGRGITARLDDLVEPRTAVTPLEPTDAGTRVLLTAPIGLRRVPVATWRPGAGVLLLGIDPLALVLAGAPDDSGLRLLHRLALVAAHGELPAGSLPRVGLLGYGAIGDEHVAGFTAAGFQVTAVCDRSDARLAAAAAVLPGVRTHAKADELLGDAAVELVGISTPPDSHASWASAVLAAGRSAVVEKPLALTAAEADTMLDEAGESGLTLAVYQNRRFDPDFLALRRLVTSGALGRVFHLEAFVGGFGHPCNYWHSDADVSGGTAFDWGSHFLDQILALVEGPVTAVRGSAHKLRWHDVTNADQVRIELRLGDGTEAGFVHSDLAAATKPKWYVLGSEGAAVGEWRHERIVARNAVGLLDEDRLAAADSPSTIWWHHADGSRTEMAQPPTAPGRWHRELADRFALGEPLTADPLQSRDVVAILEAAVVSAGDGGRQQTPVLRSR
jgi:scyllo-inositol 2-dehydrogenase (NADP+)